MGKTNRAQRTKGNTRPSSSGHSAELLSTSGKSLSGFIGFNALSKEIPSYIPVTGQHTVDDTDSSVDANFRMIMRKMLKRDPITRLKAVQEFGEHCCEEEKIVVKHVLPFWPRLFNKLALDVDRRIREATHEANGKLISKVKRDIAPYLKSIMGVWLLGQCDLYAPAASVAQSTFFTTFPPPKQAEALMFCKEEIFSYFKDNLFEQTAKSLSEPNPTSEEDAENKYTLVISSTLHAINLLLSTISKHDLECVQNAMSHIIAENKFWKYAKNKNCQIRGAWYTLLGALCRDMRNVFERFEHKLSTAVFSCLSEGDPVVAPSVWEAALHMVVNIENCWDGIDIHKIVLPQLWTLLREGGRGNASVLFPCLLPFLCKIPKDITGKESFLQQFFSSLRQSLFLERVKFSSTECDAVLTAFMECLQVTVCHNVDIKKDGSDVLEKLITAQLLPLIESSFSVGNSHLAASKLYPLLGSCMQMMERKCFEENDAETTEAFTNILTLFWDHIIMICCNVFNETQERRISMSAFLAYFFHSLNEPVTFLSKKRNRKVRFVDETEKTGEIFNDLVSEKAGLETRMIPVNKDSFIFRYTLKFCKLLCGTVDETFESCYVKLLSEIILAATSFELFEGLLSKLSISCENKNEAPRIFFEKVILKWVQQEAIDESLFTNVVDIIFGICSCVEKEEALTILNYCCEVKNAVLLKELLSKGLVTYREDSLFCEWLKGPVLGHTIIDIVKDATVVLLYYPENPVISHKISANRMTLHLCLVGSDLSDSLIDTNYIAKILLVLETSLQLCLQDDCMASKLALVNFICDTTLTILQNCKECWNCIAFDNLLASLFHLSLKPQFYLTEDLAKKIDLTWQTAIKVLVNVKSKLLNNSGFICKAADEIHNLIIGFQSAEESTKVLESEFVLLSTIEKALNSDDSLGHSTPYIISSLLERILPSEADWEQLKQGLCLNELPGFLERKVFYPFPEDNDDIPLPPNDVPQYALVAEVVSDLLINTINHVKNSDDEKIIEEYIAKHLPYLLWSFAYCEGNGYLKKEGSNEHTGTRKLQKNCFKMLAFMSHEEVLTLVNKMYNLSLSEGLEGALPLQTIVEIVKTIHPGNVATFFDLIEKANKNESIHKYITAQVLIHHISTENKIQLLKCLILEFLQDHEAPIPQTKDSIFGILAEVCCCIQESEVLQSTEIHAHLTDLIFTIIGYENSHMQYAEKEDLFTLQIVSILSAVTKYAPCMLSATLWKFIVNILTSCLKKSRMLTSYPKSRDLLLMHQTCSLLCVVSLLLGDDSEPHIGPVDLPKPFWKANISNDVYQDFLHLFLFLADISSKVKPLPKTFESLLITISEATEFISAELLFNTLMQHAKLDNLLQRSGSDMAVRPVQNIKTINTVLKMLTPYLTSSIQPLQFSSHSMLLKILPLLPDMLKDESKNENDDDDDDDDKIEIKLYPLTELLNYTNQIVENMLLDVRIGDCCTVLPYTDSYVYAMAYLLVWIEILEIFSASPSQIRTGYAVHLETYKLLSSFFSNVFRLMPKHPMQCFKKGCSTDTPKKEESRALFINPPRLSSLDCPSSKKLQSVACYVYCTALCKVPASVRTWWNNLDKKSAEIVNRFTSKHVSGILSAEEIQAVHDSEVQFNNMTVRARPGSREVIAIYTVDDSAIELSVQLPTNYPLGPITAERRGKIVIAQQEWRHWLMQLTTVLTYQNGSVLDGLNIWKKNLDKKFEGVEECMICYYILHSSTLKLPKLSCHICKKKFHSSCLYQWFHTSNKSTCPLCRNEF